MSRPGIVPFAEEHYDAARRLWEETPGVGLSAADEAEAIAGFLRRNPALSLVALDADESLVGTILVGHDGRRGLIHHRPSDPPTAVPDSAACWSGKGCKASPGLASTNATSSCWLTTPKATPSGRPSGPNAATPSPSTRSLPVSELRRRSRRPSLRRFLPFLRRICRFDAKKPE